MLASFAAGDWGWAGVLGGDPLGNFDTSGTKHALATDTAGNVYVAGSFAGAHDFDPSEGSTILTSAGAQDAFVAKFAANGSLVWVQGIGGAGRDVALSVKVAPDDSVVIGGMFSGTVDFDLGPATASLTSAGFFDAFVAKYDASGKHLWSGRLGSSAGPVAYGNADAIEGVNALAIDASGTIYAIGQINGVATAQFPGVKTGDLISAGPQNTFILSLSSIGVVQWSGVFSGKFINSGSSIAIDSVARRVLIGGLAYTSPYVGGSELIDFDPGSGVANRSGVGLGDSYLAVLGFDGALQWAERFGSSDEDLCGAVSFDSLGNVYAAGMFLGNTFDADLGAGTKTLASRGDKDVWLASYSPAGTLRWAQGVGSAGRDEALGIALDSSGEISVVGVFNGQVDFDAGAGVAQLTSHGGSDGFWLKLVASDGSYKSVTQIGGSFDDEVSAITVDARGNVIVAGTARGSVDMDPTEKESVVTVGDITRSFVARYSQSDTNLEETVSIHSIASANFTYGFKHINEAGAERYLVSSKGMRKYSEWQSPPITYWGPQANGVEGQLVYKIDFESATSSLRLKAHSPTWDFTREAGGAGKGASALEVSDDGVTWVTIYDNIATKKWGDDWTIDGALPADVVGSDSLWIRMRFLVEGAPNSSYTDAQFGRSTSGATANVFEVNAVLPGSSQKEGDSGSRPFEFEVRRTGPATGSLSVDWAVTAGDAIGLNAEDFFGGILPAGTVDFIPGEKQKTIVVNVSGDLVEEADEDFVASLSSATGVKIVERNAKATILNDDFDSLISVQSSQAKWLEGDAGMTAIPFTINRVGDFTEVATLQWTVVGSGITPAAGDDFANRKLPTGTVSFADGERVKEVVVYVLGDRAFESDEEFTITVVGTRGQSKLSAAASVIIVNDDIDIEASNTVGIREEQAERCEGNSGSSPSTAFAFTVSRSGVVTEAAMVRWAAVGSGPAPANANDFANGVFPSGAVSFAAGETSKMIVVNVHGDLLSEPDEGFAVKLFDAVGMRIGGSTAFGKILQDDTELAIQTNTPSQAEGIAGFVPFTFTITRSTGISLPLTIGWKATGAGPLPVNSADFLGGSLPLGELRFSAGEVMKTVTVNIAGDNAYEWDERFALELFGERIQKVLAFATILNDDIGVGIQDVVTIGAEGQSGSTPFTFAVRRLGPTDGTTSVAWAVAGSGPAAAAASDFKGGVLPSGILSFGPGEKQKTLAVDVLGDTVLEADEGFSVTLSAAVGATIGTASAAGVIVNDDSGLGIVAVDAVRKEGNTGSTAYTFNVTRKGGAVGAAVVNWAVAGSGANVADAADFIGGALPSGVVEFAAGETSKTIVVGVRGETLIETDESFTVTLSNASGAQIQVAAAVGWIMSDDAGVGIAALDATRFEGHDGPTLFTFVVNRTGAIGETTAVPWAVLPSGLSSVDANDFFGNELPGGVVIFKVGEASKTITIQVNGDRVAERDEGFVVALTTATNARIVTAKATGLIRGDDTSLAIGPASVSAIEGNVGTSPFIFTVTRSGRSDTANTINWSVVGNGPTPADAADFAGGTLPSGSLSFQAGETSKIITLLVKGDQTVEPEERFAVMLADTAGWAIQTGMAIGVIRNDDAGLEIGVARVARSEGQSGGTPFVFTVIRSGVVTAAATVAWAVVGSGSTAASADDFVGGVFPSGTITFAPGQVVARIQVTVAGDKIVEADEDFAVTLSGASGAQLTLDRAIGTISNDDFAALTPVAQAFASLVMAETPSRGGKQRQPLGPAV